MVNLVPIPVQKKSFKKYILFQTTSHHNSVGRVLDLKTRSCGFDSLVNVLIINCLSDETLNRGPV